MTYEEWVSALLGPSRSYPAQSPTCSASSGLKERTPRIDSLLMDAMVAAAMQVGGLVLVPVVDGSGVDQGVKCPMKSLRGSVSHSRSIYMHHQPEIDAVWMPREVTTETDNDRLGEWGECQCGGRPPGDLLSSEFVAAAVHAKIPHANQNFVPTPTTDRLGRAHRIRTHRSNPFRFHHHRSPTLRFQGPPMNAFRFIPNHNLPRHDDQQPQRR